MQRHLDRNCFIAVLALLPLSATAMMPPGDHDGDGIPDECDVDNPDRFLESEERIVPTNPTGVGNFGWGVAVDEDWAVVTAPYENRGSTVFTGAAYVFAIDADGNWTQTQKLYAADGRSSEYMGFSVAIDYPIMVVGASNRDTGAGEVGAAYVFRHQGGQTGWIREATLESPTPAAQDQFGRSVDVEGDRVVVGAYSDDEYAAGAGAVFVFDRQNQTWTQTAKLLPSTDRGGKFGHGVSISGPRILVGASNDSVTCRTGTVGGGLAYVFVEDDAGGWIEEARIEAPDCTWDRDFGESVALDGDLAAISDPQGRIDDLQYAGKTYVYAREEIDGTSVWTQTTVLSASVPTFSAGWGREEATAIDDGRIAVGAYYSAGPSGERTGAAHVFKQDESGDWSELVVLHASDGGFNESFGRGVGIRGDQVIVGASDDATGGSRYGSIYRYQLSTGDCDANGVVDACQPDVDDDGLPDACDEDRPPSNDDCGGAEVVSSGVTPGSTLLATDSGIPSQLICSARHGPEFRRDVWFTYTVECSGFVTISTCESDFDTRLDVFQNNASCDPDGLTMLSCGSEGCGDQASVQILAPEGEELFIRVGSHLDLGGTFELEIVNQSIVPDCVPGPEEPCQGDLNADGIVNAADLGIVIGTWGTPNGQGDVNGDGIVNAADLGIVIGVWGNCP